MFKEKTNYSHLNNSSRISYLRVLALILFSLGNVTLTFTHAAETPISIESKIDNYITKEMRGLKIKGLALGIAQGDEVFYLKGYGDADSAGRSVSPQTPFVLASLTKSFTAVGVMQLKERGLIDLDASVTRYIPWFQTQNENESGKITIRHILNQSSGLPTVCGRQSVEKYDDKPEALEYRVRSLSSVRLSSSVGEKYQYSNCNYYIAGLLIQVVSGQDYRVYMREHILQPLQMKNSFTDINEARLKGLAQGYRSWFGFPVAYNGDFPLSHSPSAFVVSNAADMTQYLIAHLNQGNFENTSLVSAEGVNALHSPAIEDGDSNTFYAMGWRTGEINGHSAIWHPGDRAGYQSFMALLPEERRGIVILSNTHNILTSDRFNSMAKNIFNILDGNKVEGESNLLPLLVRGLVIGVVFLQLAGMLATIRRIKRWRCDSKSIPRSKIKLSLNILAPLLINLAWVAYVFIRIPLVFASIPVLLSMIPDLGYLLVISAITALIWSVVRTIFLSLAVRQSAV